MKVKLLFFLFLASVVLFTACSKDNTPSGPGNYTSGVFVVNEGTFGGTGSITWHNPETGETVQDVFGQANGGAALGEFVQSLTLHNGKGYVVVNGANKVYVVDAVTFTYLDTIGGLALPRFFLPLDDDYGLISQWGADGLSGSVVKVDLKTLALVDTILTGAGPEKMIRQANGLVLVPNSGGFGTDSTVSILNFSATEELDRLVVPGKNPSSAAVPLFVPNPQGPFTFVHCRGSYLDANPSGWVGAVNSSLGIGYTLPPYGEDLSVSPDGQTLYIAAGGKLYKLGEMGLAAWLDQPAYGLSCQPATGNVYCADARDFNSAGEVVIYRPDGTLLSRFPTGIAPGEIVFIP